MSVDQVTKFVLTPAATGAIAAAGVAALWGAKSGVNVGSKVINMPLLVAGLSAAASVGAELANDYFFSHLPAPISALSYPAHTALSVAAQTGVVCALEDYISPGMVSEQGLPQIAALSGVSVITGSYLANQWLKPWYAKMYGCDSC